MCPKCTPEQHKDHPWVILSEVEQAHADLLQGLVTQGRSKLEKSHEDSQALESGLSELQEQTDNAKGLITETFQSYKSMLEKLRVGRYFSFVNNAVLVDTLLSDVWVVYSLLLLIEPL